MTEASSTCPDQVLEALLAKGSRSDKSDKLRKLHDLCLLEYNRRQGARDLSLSNMSRVAESHGLFKARTIYNAQSEDYRTLISAWNTHVGPVKPTVSMKKAAKVEKYAFLSQIADPAIRSLCHMGLLERDKTLAELNMLKSQTTLTVDMRPHGVTIATPTGSVAIVEAIAQLTDSERNALCTAIDSRFLAERQWRLGETGEVLDRHDRFVFMPGFATAIKKVLGKVDTAKV